MKRWITMLLALAMILCLFVACGTEPVEDDESEDTQQSDEQSEEQSEGTPEDTMSDDRYMKIELDLTGNQDRLYAVPYNGELVLNQLLFSRLVSYDTVTNETVPVLAEKWEISDDGMTYTFTLRDNIYFHDGEPITADDVVFTFNNAIIGVCSYADMLASVEGYAEASSGAADSVSGVQKIDEKTVAFKLTQLDAMFLDAVSYATFAILPEHILGGKTPAEINDDAEFWAKPIGSGPYYVAETNYPNYIVMKAFDKYFEPAGIPQILATCYADRESVFAATIAGDLDFLDWCAEEQAINMVNNNPDLEYAVAPSTYRRCLNFNLTGTAGDGTPHPSIGNPKVRKALDMLVDKEAIAAIFGSQAVVLTSEVNPSLAEYNTDLPTWKRDVEGAVKILEEEGFDFETPLRLYSSYTDQLTVDMMEALVQQLAEGGVKAEYVLDGTNWEPYLVGHDYDIFYGGDMSKNVVNFYSWMATNAQGSTTIFPMDDPEWVAYQKARYDDLVAQWKASLDPVEQKEIIDQLQVNAYEDMYHIPLYSTPNFNIYNTAHVTGIPAFALDYRAIVHLRTSEWALVD